MEIHIYGKVTLLGVVEYITCVLSGQWDLGSLGLTLAGLLDSG